MTLQKLQICEQLKKWIESEVYDEFLAKDLIEQKGFQQANNKNNDTKAIKARKLKEVSTYVLYSGAICSALLS